MGFYSQNKEIFEKVYKYHVSNILWHEERQFFEITTTKGEKKFPFFLTQ